MTLNHWSGTFAVSLNSKLASALNEWRLRQVPVPAPDEAIYQLLLIALTYEGVEVGTAPTPLVTSEEAATDRLIAAFKAAQAG